MTVLGLDSCAKTAGVAVVQNGKLLYETYLATGFTHSETLLQIIQNALHLTRLVPADIHAYAVCAGPGSFTGLRIGMSLIKGLADAAETPCVPISSLEAFGFGCDCPGIIVPAMDARRGEVYSAAFLRDAGNFQRLSPDAAVSAQTALDTGLHFSKEYRLPLTLLGDGAALLEKAAAIQNVAVSVLPERTRCRAAAAAAEMGYSAVLAGKTVSAAALRPDYHRLCQAERERAEKLANTHSL